ncbi:AraC family transcriptional regulator ligand-binding domain-containing protein [Sorangium sp. So ce134]
MTLPSEAGAPPSTRVPTITVRTVVDLLRYAQQRNLPCGELAALVEPLADRLEERVPSERFIEALEVAVRATGDEDFILHFTEGMPLERLDLLAYLIASSPDVATALADGARFIRLLNEGVEARLVPDSAEPRFVVSTDPLGLPRDRPGIIQQHVFVMATSLRVARAFSGVDVAPRTVHLATSRPRDTTELERFFRAEIRFDAAVTEMTLSPGTLALPLRKADQGLHAVLVRLAEDVIGRLPRALGTWADQVRHALLESAGADAMELPIRHHRSAPI